MLFKNEFLSFQFRFKPKISSRKLFPPDSTKIRPKISPRKKRFSNHYRNAKKIKKNYTVLKKMPFNAITFDKHRKTAEANKK